MIMECWCCDMILDRDHGTHAMPAEASRSACYTVIDGACATKSGACRLLGPLFVAFGPDSRALVTILTQVHRFRWIRSYDCVRGINYGTLPSCSNASVLFNLSCFAKYSLSSGRARNDRGCTWDGACSINKGNSQWLAESSASRGQAKDCLVVRGLRPVMLSRLSIQQIKSFR